MDNRLKLWTVLLVGAMLALFSLVPVGAHEDMAHVRAAHYVAGGANVDVLLDGEAVVSGLEPALVSEFIEIEPGQHSLDVVPTGEGADKAMVSVADAALEAGHYYDLALVGQVTDEHLQTLMIDETAAMENCDMSKDVMRILVNNIEGLPALSFYEQGEFVEKNIPYGGYSAQCFPAFFWDTGKAIAGEDLDKILFDFDSEADGVGGFWEPYNVYFWGLMGKYPGEPGADYDFGGGVNYVVAPDVKSYLAAFSGLGLSSDGSVTYEFDTFVKALEASGVEFDKDTPYTIFVPTDGAFAGVPQDELDKLMADPTALSNVVKYHIVEGNLDYAALAAAGSVKTLNGAELTITPSEDDGATFAVNGARVANFSYPTLEGTRIWFVDDMVLMPPG